MPSDLSIGHNTPIAHEDTAPQSTHTPAPAVRAKPQRSASFDDLSNMKGPALPSSGASRRSAELPARLLASAGTRLEALSETTKAAASAISERVENANLQSVITKVGDPTTTLDELHQLLGTKPLSSANISMPRISDLNDASKAHDFVSARPAVRVVQAMFTEMGHVKEALSEAVDPAHPNRQKLLDAFRTGERMLGDCVKSFGVVRNKDFGAMGIKMAADQLVQFPDFIQGPLFKAVGAQLHKFPSASQAQILDSLTENLGNLGKVLAALGDKADPAALESAPGRFKEVLSHFGGLEDAQKQPLFDKLHASMAPFAKLGVDVQAIFSDFVNAVHTMKPENQGAEKGKLNTLLDTFAADKSVDPDTLEKMRKELNRGASPAAQSASTATSAAA
jgi:hypothetical protein